MSLKKVFLNKYAFSLIELVVVLVILSLMIMAGGLTMKPSINKRKVRNCSAKMISDINLIRSRAQSEGRRTIFQLTNVAKAADVDGDGITEYYIGFVDSNTNSTYDNGEEAFVHGRNGDELCANLVSVDKSGTPDTTITNDQIIFNPLGFSMNGATKQDIFLTGSSYSARISLISLTGMLRSYINTDNCGGDGCDEQDNWVEIR